MRLSGIIPPLLTPFKESGEVDFDRIPLLVEFMKPYVKGFLCAAHTARGVDECGGAEKGLRSGRGMC